MVDIKFLDFGTEALSRAVLQRLAILLRTLQEHYRNVVQRERAKPVAFRTSRLIDILSSLALIDSCSFS